MVYIKLTNQMWITSGLQKLIPQESITKIQNQRYIPYEQFKIASKMSDHPIHTLLKRQHIINNIDMKKIKKQAEITPEQKKFKLQLKAKHQLRMMNKNIYLNNPTNNFSRDQYYFQQKKDQSIKDLSKSLSFGMTFIFSFFMAGLTGYYFGIYFLGLQFVHSLIVAMFFIMFTIIIQTLLFIIKQSRDDKIRDKALKQKKKTQKSFNFTKPTTFPRFQDFNQGKLFNSNVKKSQNQTTNTQSKPKSD